MTAIDKMLEELYEAQEEKRLKEKYVFLQAYKKLNQIKKGK